MLLGLLSIGAIAVLEHRSNASRDAELTLAQARIDLNQLQNAPFQAHKSTGGSPEFAQKLMRTGKARIATRLETLRRESPPASLRRASAPLRENYALLDGIYVLGVKEGYGQRADRLAFRARETAAATGGLLDAAGRSYHRRASRSQMQAMTGSALVILLLLGAFAVLYRRSASARATAERLAHENERLLGLSRVEALTDSLTGLHNRRALIDHLNSALADSGGEDELLLALFDLDGFKQYNDTFGHAAGDALLSRLGERLAGAIGSLGTAYRMGGDEFCLLARVAPDAGAELAFLATGALSESGDAFDVGCSCGMARLPVEAASAEEALVLADQRMYEDKAGRTSASRQSTDVLLKVLSERTPDLNDRLDGVAELAYATAQRLALPEHEIKRIRLAAELHDVGKTAIPDTILDKGDELDEEEWAFMHRHTLIGERIVLAAPSLAHTAELVRSSHEWFDGRGYPDGLRGDAIPLGASVIAVCDAFDAMISERPYHATLEVENALRELQRCSGTQFDPRVVEAFLAVAREFEPAGSRSA